MLTLRMPITKIGTFHLNTKANLLWYCDHKRGKFPPQKKLILSDNKHLILRLKMAQKTSFKCASCPAKLPTRQLTTGEVVKKWADNTCGDCWVADDIIKNRVKYSKFRPQMVTLLENMRPCDLVLIVDDDVPSTPFGDLIFELYHGDDERNWEEIICDFRDFLGSVKANNLKLAQRLHQRLVTDHWWED